MGVTKKDHDAWAQEGQRILAIARRLEPVILPLIRLMIRPGFIRRRFDRLAPARIGKVSRLAARGEHARAADLAIETLKEHRDRPEAFKSITGMDYWWFFLRMAAENLEKVDDPAKRAEVVALAQSVERPSEDYSGAACFLCFARWTYAAGDHDEAIAFAETAARIDPTWAEPDFLLGWYRLVLGGGDALEPLKSALRKDPKVLFRIASDPVCRRHPHIIASLKAVSRESLITLGTDGDSDFSEFPAGPTASS